MNPVQRAMPTSAVTLGGSFEAEAPSGRETRRPTTYALSSMSETVASDPKVNSMAIVMTPPSTAITRVRCGHRQSSQPAIASAPAATLANAPVSSSNSEPSRALTNNHASNAAWTRRTTSIAPTARRGSLAVGSAAVGDAAKVGWGHEGHYDMAIKRPRCAQKRGGVLDVRSAPDLVRTLVDGDLDMVTAVRDQEGRGAAYPPGHHFGNRAFSALLGGLFGTRPTDLFSGYRAFSRRFVKSFPATSRGFEIETELTIHALEQRISLAERSTRYFERPRGSVSKLATYRDGMRILGKTIMLFKDVKPATFFGGFAVLFGVAGLLLGIGVIMEFMETRYVTRLPTAVLATGLVLLAFLALTCGLILDSVTRGRRESKRMAYLAAGSADTRWSGEMMLRRSNQALAGTHAFPPGHYHSPIVDPEELKKRQDAMWTGDDPLLGIDLNDQVHRRILTEVFPKYIAEFDYPVELDCAPGP